VVLPKRWIVERTIAGSIAAEGSPRIGRISTERRSVLAPRLNPLISENSAIRPESPDGTLEAARFQPNHWKPKTPQSGAREATQHKATANSVENYEQTSAPGCRRPSIDKKWIMSLRSTKQANAVAGVLSTADFGPAAEE